MCKVFICHAIVLKTMKKKKMKVWNKIKIDIEYETKH